MIDQFHPIMQQASVTKTVNYYNQTFVPLRGVAVGGIQAAKETPALIGGLAKQLHMSASQMQQFLGTDFPAMAKLLASFPQLVFNLFTWFFVVPGVLLVLLAGWPLLAERRGRPAAVPAHAS